MYRSTVLLTLTAAGLALGEDILSFNADFEDDFGAFDDAGWTRRQVGKECPHLQTRCHQRYQWVSISFGLTKLLFGVKRQS